MLAECLKIFGGKFRHSEKAIFFDITLQMFTGNYRVFAGKSECWDFKFMEIAGNLILQGYYGDSLH